MEIELQFHIERYTEDLVRKSVSIEEAKHRAQVEFGAVEARKEECREAVGLRSRDELRGDVRYALHILTKNYGFTAVAVLSLVLAIGANTAIFSVIEAVLFRPLPYIDPARLVDVWRQDLKNGKTKDTISYPDFLDLRNQNTAFTDMATYRESRGTVLTDSNPERIAAAVVSTNLFRLLGAIPEMGRTFRSDDEVDGKGQVTVLTHERCG